MGGSFALAAQQAKLIDHVIGYSYPKKDAEQFAQHNIIQSVALSAAEAVAQADVVLLAAPVAALADLLKQIAPALAPHALIMDVGSTKRSVQRAAQQYLGSHYSQFVGAHPIAGKEKAGYSAPYATLYQDKTVILCPDEQTKPSYLQQAQQLWHAIGARTKNMQATQHDRGLAAVSHLPHFIAFAYMDALLNQSDAQDLLQLGGPGFRDFSRIAGCDPLVWRDILPDNQDQILPLLQAVRQSLELLEHQITQNNTQALEAMLSRASQARIHWK